MAPFEQPALFAMCMSSKQRAFAMYKYLSPVILGPLMLLRSRLAVVRDKVLYACTMLVQEEYAREGIDWSYVEFIDNQDCLDVLEGSKDSPSLAVFPLIDEACRLPRATYQVWLAYL